MTTTRQDEPWDDDSFKTIDLWITELAGEHAATQEIEVSPSPPPPGRRRREATPAVEPTPVSLFVEPVQTTEDITALAIALPRRLGRPAVAALLSAIATALLSAAALLRG